LNIQPKIKNKKMRRLIRFLEGLPSWVWSILPLMLIAGFIWLFVASHYHFGRYCTLTGFFGLFFIVFGWLLFTDEDKPSKIFGAIVLVIGTGLGVLFLVHPFWTII
jgi:multidrug transporter EmrE-like cation transporter